MYVCVCVLVFVCDMSVYVCAFMCGVYVCMCVYDYVCVRTYMYTMHTHAEARRECWSSCLLSPYLIPLKQGFS